MKEPGLIKLEEFVAHNDKLELLEAKLGEFNPLRVLKMESYEIRHSNILAWLLGPNENHGLGDKFLKKFLVELAISPEDTSLPLSITQIQGMNFFDVQILREDRNTDILIISKINKLILLIENKVYANPSSAQIKNYAADLKKNYPNYQIVPVLLTLTADSVDPSDFSCLILTYEHVFSIIKSIVDLYKGNLNSKVLDFISFYLKSLGVITMQDNNEIVKLCKEIYKQHKDAIDTINEYGKTSSLGTVFDEFSKKNPLVETYRNNSNFWFLPEEFKNKVPKFCEGWCSEYAFSYWFCFSTKENWLGLIIEVGPIKDSKKRVDFIRALYESGSFKVRKGALAEGKRLYTRIFSKYKKYEEWDDFGKTMEQFEILYLKDAKEATTKLKEVIKNFKW
jgi:hypothetical protein